MKFPLIRVAGIALAPTLMAGLLATLLPAVAAHAGPIGPKNDGASYFGNDITYNFRGGVNNVVTYDENIYEDDPVNGGQMIVGTNQKSIVSVDDVYSSPLTLPFSFNFYGQDYGQLWVSSNGLASFVDPQYSRSTSNPLPDVDYSPVPMIAVGWNDLDDMTVTDKTFGTAGSQEYVIQWSGALYDALGLAIMQLILHEGTNDIEMQYQTVDGSYKSFSSGLNNQDGSAGLQMTYLGEAVCYYSYDPEVPFCAADASWGNIYTEQGYRISVAPVPEPETYALMLAGLALVGVAARRRKAK